MPWPKPAPRTTSREAPCAGAAATATSERRAARRARGTEGCGASLVPDTPRRPELRRAGLVVGTSHACALQRRGHPASDHDRFAASPAAASRPCSTPCPSSSTSAGDGATAPAARRSPSRTRRPARRSPTSPTRRRRTRSTRSAPPHDAWRGDWRDERAARARGHPAPRLRGDRRAHRRARAAHDARDGQAAGRVRGRDRLRRELPALVRRGGRPRRRPLRDARGRHGPAADDEAARRARASSSRRGTSRWRWARARSARRSRPAARWSSSRPSSRRCRCSCSRGSSRRRGCPAACSTSSPRAPAARSWSRSSATRARASCRSPARPRSAARSSSSPPSRSCASRWSSAATRPFVVFEDADVDDAVEGAVVAKMRNIGEACTAANRFHVARADRRRVRRQARREDGRDEDRAAAPRRASRSAR